MKVWVGALVMASVVELPLVILLSTTGPAKLNGSVIGRAIGWYHLMSLWFGYAVITLWNPGPRVAPTGVSNAVYWFSIFAFQVVVTTPVAFLVLKGIGHCRKR